MLKSRHAFSALCLRCCRLLVAGVVGLLLLTVMVLSAPSSAFAEDTSLGFDPDVLDGSSVADANRVQLVMVVRFKGDATGDGDTGLNAPYPSVSSGSAGAGAGDGALTKWAKVMERLNESRSVPHWSPSLYQYLALVSRTESEYEGACRLRSVSPQTDKATGRVAYLTLPRSRSDYTNTGVLLDDALAAFNAAYPSFDGRILDGDGNGVADNVLIVPEVGNDAPKVGTPLWAHEADYGGSLRIGGASSIAVGTYTVVDSGRISCGSVGVVVHETLHAFGAKDLYRSAIGIESASNKPVGVWDIMAQPGESKLMRPLAISREDCGWITLEEVDEGSFTLYAPESGKRQAVKFKTPYSSTEYFVAEFRHANTNIGTLAAVDTYQDSLPSTIGGSGLVVYRVDPEEKDTGITSGNKGDEDYVYVFREGETGGPRGDGVGELRHAQLTAPGYKMPTTNPLLPTSSPSTRSQIGSTNADDGLEEGALTYADGTNSGIVLRVTAQTEESITFTIDRSASEGWGWWREGLDAKGTSPLPSKGVADTKVVTGPDGALYQLCELENSQGARLFRYDGSSWKSLGLVGSGCQHFNLAAFNGSLYVCGSRYRPRQEVSLWQWDGSRWDAVATVDAGANNPVLGEAAGALYLFADGSGDAASLYRLSGDSLVKETSLGKGYIAGSAIVDVEGSPAVVAGNFAQRKTMLYLWRNGVWNEQLLHEGCAQVVDAAPTARGAVLLTLYQDGTSSTLRMAILKDGQKPVVTALPSSLPAAFGASLALSGSQAYVALAVQGTQQVKVYQAALTDPARWEPVGTTVVSPTMGVDVAMLGATPACASVPSATSPVSLRLYGMVDPSTIAPLPVSPAKPTTNGSASSGAQPGANTGTSSSGTQSGTNAGTSSGAASKPSSSSSSAVKPSSGSSSSAKPSGNSSSAKPSAGSSSAKPTVAKKPKKPATPAWRSFKCAKKTITVRWKKAKGASGYQVKYSTSKKFTKKTTKVKSVSRGSATSVKLTSLKSKRTYYAKIRAYQKVGKAYAYSSWSKVKKVKTK